MRDDRIRFRILFRSPKYPVIVIAEDDIWPAYDIKELGTVCYVSEPIEDSDIIKVIDSSGEEFWYLPEQVALTPGFMQRKWTKKKIIQLFNQSETAKEINVQYSMNSLSSKRLSTIVADICSLIDQNNDC